MMGSLPGMNGTPFGDSGDGQGKPHPERQPKST
jgi:hypothetical protein